MQFLLVTLAILATLLGFMMVFEVFSLKLLVIVALVLAIFFWVDQLLTLMNMSDDQFPGRFDKVIWATILIVLTIPGAIVFAIWRAQRQTEHEVNQAAERLTDMIRRSKPDSKTS